jgi:hypothetical protein
LRSQLVVGVRSTASFPHLPPGREPGAQSMRNRTGSPLLEGFVGLVGVGMLVAGVFVAAGGRGPRFDRREEALGGAFFALIGLVCAGWAYSQRRSRRPLRLPKRLRGTTLAVERDEPRRGEELSVSLSLTKGAVEQLEVGLVCVERYDYLTRVQHRGGTTVLRRTAEATAHEEWQAIEPAAGERTLSFEIPRDTPYSYEGECVSYAWRISARVVRRLRSDPRIDHPLWVRA